MGPETEGLRFFAGFPRIGKHEADSHNKEA